MQLADPIWLWGLSGLLIPIGIHLLSRKEGKVIRFGSLRHLKESHTKQSISIRLNEVVLLIIRCAIIFFIVLFLCGLNLRLFQAQKSQWIILEEGTGEDPSIATMVDSLKQEGFQVKSMTKGFPNASSLHQEPFTSYWDMVSQLPVQSLKRAIIVSYSFSSKFRGKRIALPENITWISIQPQPKEFTLSKVRFSNDSVLIRAARSSSQLTTFTNVTEAADGLTDGNDTSVKTTLPDTLRITIYADREFDYDRKVIEASLRAIEKSVPVIMNITTSSNAEIDKSTNPHWVVWLSRDAPDKTLSTNWLILRENDNDPTSLLVNDLADKTHRQWLITKRLNEETALKEHLALNLASLLLSNEITESRADSLNRTTQPEQFLWSVNKQGVSEASTQIKNDEAELLLLIVIVAMLIVERFIAFKRNV